ncbi:hypothetical protein VTK73DRAFT_6647 [Phialemonium thermophilum]|uniref:Cupin, RmlC-type n=1 Tax=Phialemonium thermophilum TaxID=223376 RepID=A0ABR3WIH8_9PEZI
MDREAWETQVVTRPLPNAVRYDLSAPDQVQITLPPRSLWSSGLHWHETHVEYLRVVQGRVRVRLGGLEKIVRAAGGGSEPAPPPEIRIDKNVWHEWSRADAGEDDDGEDDEDAVVVERTVPADGEKSVFFWNLNGVLLEAQRGVATRRAPVALLPAPLRSWVSDAWVTLSLFVIFAHLDNVPVLLDALGLASRVGWTPGWDSPPGRLLRRVDGLCSHVVLGAAAVLGWALGIRAVRLELTPDGALRRWTSHRASHKASHKERSA